MRHLHDDAPLSRAELSRRSGVRPATVSTVVGALEEAGLIDAQENETSDRQVGKPPTMIRLRPTARNVIAVDISEPAAARAAVVGLDGGTITETVRSLDGVEGLDLLDSLDALIADTIDRATSHVIGISVGVPGVVVGGGTVVLSANLGWSNLELGDHLRARFEIPVHVMNDANAAATAELASGGHDCTALALVKIGDGVGAGFALEDGPLLGAHNAAGEIGHLVVDPGGPLCHCGHRGCLETFVTAPNIGAALADREIDDGMVVRTAAERLGVALASIVAILDVDHILISGPRSTLGERFCRDATMSLRRRCLGTAADSVIVDYATLGDDIVRRGLARQVIINELENQLHNERKKTA
jgi:predicted NBD/HSP70 family sugar kinase